jgi:hypothetical protein
MGLTVSSRATEGVYCLFSLPWALVKKAICFRPTVLELAVLLVLYVVLNIMLVVCAPYLHHVRLEMTVLDIESNKPITGVEASWLYSHSSSGTEWTRPIGVSDESGRVITDVTVQEQPRWAMPEIGSFAFRNWKLRLVRNGQDIQTVELRELIPDVSYGTKVIAVPIMIGKR